MLCHETEFEDDDGDVADDCVRDDHYQNSAKNARRIDDEVEAGPKNDTEAGDVGDPAYLADDGDEDGRSCVFKFFENVACCLKDEAEGCDYDGPEIDPAVVFEGYVDEDEEFEAHPICDCAESGDKREGGRTEHSQL